MEVVKTLYALGMLRQGLTGRVGLVPTMGYLHEGHLSLVRYARDENDHVLATIFVNPTQFGEGDDLGSYPRDIPRDLASFEAEGVDVVFIPSVEAMYPPDYQTYVTVEKVTKELEGAHRPGHFRGVATIVAKLFNLTQPDVAYFGQKRCPTGGCDSADGTRFELSVGDCGLPDRPRRRWAGDEFTEYLFVARRKASGKCLASFFEGGWQCL